jgi:hypothetical protein
MNQFLKFVLDRPDSWVRLAETSWHTNRRVVLRFEVAVGRGKTAVGNWWVRAEGVREFAVCDADGGGIQLSVGSHPAVRQYTDRLSTLRFQGTVQDPARTISDLWMKHVEASDDWIPIDRYLPTPQRLQEILLKRAGTVCRGPAFLLRQYATALNGPDTKTTLTRHRASAAVKKRVSVLHFGSSFVIAERFVSARAG